MLIRSLKKRSFNIRTFKLEDAEACFRIRAKAFIKVFYDEIGPEGVAAGINAYMPGKFVFIAETMPFFVAVNSTIPIGFITLRFTEDSRIEILFLYVKLDCRGKGVGTELIRFAEDWVRKNHPGINQIFLDTAVPKYNQKYYEKIGYTKTGESICQYPDWSVKAVRLIKELQ